MAWQSETESDGTVKSRFRPLNTGGMEVTHTAAPDGEQYGVRAGKMLFHYPSAADSERGILVQIGKPGSVEYVDPPSEPIRDLIRSFHKSGYPHHVLLDELESQYPQMAEHLALAHQSIYAPEEDQ